jgi:hypothetical protein
MRNYCFLTLLIFLSPSLFAARYGRVVTTVYPALRGMILPIKRTDIVRCSKILSKYPSVEGDILAMEHDPRRAWYIPNQVKLKNKLSWLPALYRYLRTRPSEGPVYHGKVDGADYFFHKTWLRKSSEDKFVQQEINRLLPAFFIK